MGLCAGIMGPLSVFLAISQTGARDRRAHFSVALLTGVVIR
jgi:hypothetical protein